MAKDDVVQPMLDKVCQLDPDDPVRRGILQKLGDWWLSRKTSRRAKIWDEVEKRWKYVKY